MDQLEVPTTNGLFLSLKQPKILILICISTPLLELIDEVGVILQNPKLCLVDLNKYGRVFY